MKFIAREEISDLGQIIEDAGLVAVDSTTGDVWYLHLLTPNPRRLIALIERGSLIPLDHSQAEAVEVLTKLFRAKRREQQNGQR